MVKNIKFKKVEINGLKLATEGRSCEKHSICGEHVKVDDVLVLYLEQTKKIEVIVDDKVDDTPIMHENMEDSDNSFATDSESAHSSDEEKEMVKGKKRKAEPEVKVKAKPSKKNEKPKKPKKKNDEIVDPIEIVPVAYKYVNGRRTCKVGYLSKSCQSIYKDVDFTPFYFHVTKVLPSGEFASEVEKDKRYGFYYLLYLSTP